MFVVGVDEEIVLCWIGALEEVLTTNKEAVEKARKFDELKSQFLLMNEKYSQLKKLYLMTIAQSLAKDKPSPTNL